MNIARPASQCTSYHLNFVDISPKDLLLYLKTVYHSQKSPFRPHSFRTPFAQMAVTIHDPFKDHRVITSLRLAEYPTLTPDDPTSQNRYVLYFLPQDIESGIVSAEIGAPEPEYDSQGELVWNLLNHNAPGNQLRHWDVPLFAFTKMDELIEVIYKRHFQHYVLSENGSGRREWT